MRMKCERKRGNGKKKKKKKKKKSHQGNKKENHQINIVLSRESKCCFRIQKEEIDHLETDKNQPLISVVDLSRAIKKTV